VTKPQIMTRARRVEVYSSITLALRFTESGKAVYKDSLKMGPTFYERVFWKKPLSKITVVVGVVVD
jgi:hypothetical protein